MPRVARAFQGRRVHTDHYEANQKFGYLVGCVHSNHWLKGPFSSRGHYCRAGCCLPGFVWTTIYPLDGYCPGSGSPPPVRASGVAAEMKPAVEREHWPGVASPREGPGSWRSAPSIRQAAPKLWTLILTPFIIVCSDAGPRKSTPRQRGLARLQWLRCNEQALAASTALWLVWWPAMALSSSLQSDLVVAFFQSSPMGFPCKPMLSPCLLLSGCEPVKSLQRGQG